MLKVLLLEDQVDNLNWMALLVESHPELMLVFKAQQVSEAQTYLKNHAIDLAFVDVELENESGFDLFKRMEKVDFRVVFVTAHQRYAAKAFEFLAVDFLLKPVTSEALNQSVERIKKRERTNYITQQLDILEEVNGNLLRINKIGLFYNHELNFIEFDNIICCKGEGVYTKFFIENEKPILVSRNLKEYQDLLPKEMFYRIHRSYIVNIHKLKKFVKSNGGYVVLSNGVEIPIPKKRKMDFMKVFLSC